MSSADNLQTIWTQIRPDKKNVGPDPNLHEKLHRRQIVAVSLTLMIFSSCGSLEKYNFHEWLALPKTQSKIFRSMHLNWSMEENDRRYMHKMEKL